MNGKKRFLNGALGGLVLPWTLLPLALLPWAIGCGDSANGKQQATGATGAETAERVPVEVDVVRQEAMSAVYSTSATLRAS
ncbi:MAG TPA: hypothetical protein VMV46_01030, partial [Thermoanaerobaculia bacterium]|nr:hypothetical protein [Thermoanaerobaculia bacterium]